MMLFKFSSLLWDAMKQNYFDIAKITLPQSWINCFFFFEKACVFVSGTHFYDYLHPTQLQSGITEFLLSSQHSDVILIVTPPPTPESPSPTAVRFPAHKIVLSSKCRVMRTLFDACPGQTEFHVDHISDPNVLFLLLSFIYTGKVCHRWVYGLISNCILKEFL